MLPPHLPNLEDEGLVLPTISDLDGIIDQSLINEGDFDIDEGTSDLNSQPVFSEINPSLLVSALQTQVSTDQSWVYRHTITTVMDS